MKVDVRLFSILRRYGPPDGSPAVLDLGAAACLEDALIHLGIPDDVEMVIVINGRPGQRETPLKEGDRIVLFPPVAGG
jgi:sulfur-carrier protein